MKVLLTSILLLIAASLYAQNLEAVDKKVRLYPKKFTSPERLAEQITKDFSTDTEKVRAVYTWLTHNIKYDLERFYKGDTEINFSYTDQADYQRKLAAVNAHSVKETLRTNKAVCEGYARTFKAVSEYLGVPCLFIGGYSKASIADIGKVPSQEDHSWNAVRIENKWHLIDVTWGAGNTYNNKWISNFDDYYFFTDPSQFALTHLPGDPELAFTNKKISKKEFYDTPVYSKEFSKSNLKLISPLKGQLIAKANDSIQFEIGKLPENISLHYAYKENMVPVAIETKCTGSKCSFKVPFIATSTTILYIIANRQTALQYKVAVKK
jgi:transglutaminase/protease-like cytokinesis protein 3